MRSGACTIQQALTAEAAAIVKLSVNLARRRGHAQVTPLHVAATLLNSSASASYLLRRACIRSRPHHPTSLPLHGRALELCFNVALNRLPTSPPPSSSSLLHSNPSLSNSLIAALKRAQAHQRRGCIESQNHHLHQSQQQSNQPLLAIKVELEQLIISILDDPSVSRVMREAGFSSTSVKQNLEDESTAGFAMASNAKPQSFSYDTNGVFLPTHFLKPIERKEEDVKVVLEAMTRRKQQGKRSGNAVVVGDNASVAEGVANELMFRLERGEVPEELKGAQIMKLQLSYIYLRLMSRVDLEIKISDLRRRIISSLEKGVVVYAGDLRWAVDDEGREKDALAGFNPVDYFISEVGKFLTELKSDINGREAKFWFLASSSYQTYMKCMMMNPSIESQWSLQTVVVPSGGLALSLQAPSGRDSLVPKLNQYHFEMKETRSFSTNEEGERLLCCAECILNYEKEAKESISGTTHLPFWLQTQKHENLHKECFLELRRKWNRLCKSLHQTRTSQIQASPHFNQKYPSSHPWWSCSLPCSKSKFSMEPSSVSFTSQSSRKLLMASFELGGSLLTDSATSTNQKRASPLNPEDLTQKLKENIPWQSQMIPLIVDQLFNYRFSAKKGKNWMLIHGNDQIAKRRLARVVAKSFFGSTKAVIIINARKSAKGAFNLLTGALEKESKSLVLIEGINWADSEFTNSIKAGIEIGSLKDSCGRDVDLSSGIFILTTTSSSEHEKMEKNCDRVLKMRMWTEEEEHLLSLDRQSKKPRLVGRGELDLNVAVDGVEEEEDGAPSDLTHEVVAGGGNIQLPGVVVLTLEANHSLVERIAEDLTTRLRRAFEEVAEEANGERVGRLMVDQATAEELARAAGSFLEAEFEKWVRDVFQICILTVKISGKLRLGIEGKDGHLEQLGFMESVLPKKILVD